jgi:hypothetical protein
MLFIEWFMLSIRRGNDEAERHSVTRLFGSLQMRPEPLHISRRVLFIVMRPVMRLGCCRRSSAEDQSQKTIDRQDKNERNHFSDVNGRKWRSLVVIQFEIKSTRREKTIVGKRCNESRKEKSSKARKKTIAIKRTNIVR